MKIHSAKILFLFFLIIALAQSAVLAQSELDNLYETRQYFVLRDKLVNLSGEASPEILFYRGFIANRFNEPEKSVSYLNKYVKRAAPAAKNLRSAYEILADNYSKTYHYQKSAEIYKLLIEKYKGKIDEGSLKGYENMFGLWNALANVPLYKISSKTDSELQGSRDKAKLLNIPVEVGSQKMDFVFDTGAGISTMTASTAQKLGLKIIEADVSVGSSTDKTVKSRLAVVPVMKIGQAVIHNAVFLVFEDKSLYFPPIDYQIHAIIGFPIIKSFGKITITRGDQVLISARSEKNTRTGQNMCFDSLKPLILAYYNNKPMLFSFDTGANTSTFYPAFYKSEEPEIVKNSILQKTRIGGAGGFKEISGYKLNNLNLNIGGKRAQLTQTFVSTELFDEGSRYFYGNLGQDVIKQFERMTLDFRAMRISFD